MGGGVGEVASGNVGEAVVLSGVDIGVGDGVPFVGSSVIIIGIGVGLGVGANVAEYE